MPIGEFSLIKRYFSGCTPVRPDVAMGIGDDAAIVSIPPDNQLVVTTDTLVSGVHFLEDMPARAIGYKAMAVNLSDLAAMGAMPKWVTLSLTLPKVDEHWISAFAGGLREQADYFGVQLIGGDTTRGPLSITLTAMGTVPVGQALHRGGAWPGDWLYVTGTLGDSAAGLDLLLGKLESDSDNKSALIERHYHPSARLLAGQALRQVASSTIDISDGLVADLKHVLSLSGCNAHIDLEHLPLSKSLLSACSREQAEQYALTGGEDYELLFTVAEENRGSLTTTLTQTGTQYTCIGRLASGEGAVQLLRDGLPVERLLDGWQHF